MTQRNLKLLIVTFIITTLSSYAQKDVFLFSFFQNNGADGLHLAYSYDGLKWKALNDNKSFLKPTVGNDKLMRDPCILLGPDNKFHMVWTVSWGEKGIGYANSTDLINWSEQQFIPVMEHEPNARNSWAPEIAYDKETEQYIIYWSTTIPGKYPKTDKTGDDGYNHRMYYTTTKSFKNYSPTKLLYDQGFNVIDGVIVKDKNEYVMVLKDETRHPPAKNLKVATAANFIGPYSKPSKPFTNTEYAWAEGPTVIKHNDYWFVYFDQYDKNSMGGVKTKDWKNFINISDQLSFPKNTRHGTVFKVPEKYLIELKKRFESK